MSEKIFIKGMSFKKPSEKAPEFIKGNISFKVDDFIAFAQANKTESGWLNVDLMKSREGKLYLCLNTYKKGEKVAPKEEEAPIITEDNF